MQRSESIAELAKALCAAQAEIEGAAKSSENPHFRSRYADLGAVWEAIRSPMTRHGLSIIQSPRACEMGVEVETTLLHTSGQYMTDTLAMPVSRRDAQGFGSAITYARRYALMAVAGIAPVDDDGNDAAGKRDGVEPMGSGKPRDDIGKKDSWADWARGDAKSDCAKWLIGCKTLIANATHSEDLTKWMEQAEAAKRIKALYDHRPESYDRLMKAVQDRQDELRNKEAA